MQITSAGANKLIKNYKEEISSILQEERDTITTSYAPGEDPLPSDYDFLATDARLDDLHDKVARLKHSINVFNTTTVLEDIGCTIDEALVRMAILSDKKSRLSRMKSIQPLTRSSGSLRSGPEFTKRNYDAAEVETEYKKVSDELTKLQLSLDKTNLTETFEFEE